MVKLSENTKKQLEKRGVGIVYFFGSRAEGIAIFKSDYDIGVVLAGKNKPDLEDYSKVYEILSKEIPDYYNSKLDISFLQSANPALAMSAVKNGLVLYEKDPVFRADFEEEIIKKYNDYLFLKKDFEEATLAAFK